MQLLQEKFTAAERSELAAQIARTKEQNAAFDRPKISNTKGVYWNAEIGKFEVFIWKNGKNKRVGYTETEVKGAELRAEYLKSH